VVDPEAPGRLVIKEVAAPQAGPTEALVQVEAISLNRGEAMIAQVAEAGVRPGWDLAGTVIKQAANGTGPQTGSRVLGSVPSGSWAEQVAVPTHRLAKLPANVTFAQGATIPTAGLTAFRALQKGGLLLNKRVLITGSTGGVGQFALQLARLGDAYVIGTVRQPHQEKMVREMGANEIIVGDDLSSGRVYGPYHLIIDLVGGKVLESAIPQLSTGGTCVVAGGSASSSTTIDFMSLIRAGRTTIYVLNMYAEFDNRPRSEDLAWLAQLVAEQKLQTSIEVEASWHDAGEVAQHLLRRQFTGKAVLHLE
jgi:NADPH:quinone reductase-like Zn-dependent oxidoreductase